MADTAFDPLRAGRGLAVTMVSDPNDLARASTRTRCHRGPPTQHDGLRPRTAALAQDFGCGWHQRPRAQIRHTPLRAAHACPRYNGSGLGTLAPSAKSALEAWLAPHRADGGQRPGSRPCSERGSGANTEVRIVRA